MSPVLFNFATIYHFLLWQSMLVNAKIILVMHDNAWGLNDIKYENMTWKVWLINCKFMEIPPQTNQV